MTDNKAKIKALVIEMLNASQENMISNIDKILKSGCIDTEGWDENINPRLLPNCITAALLQDEATQYDGKGTSFEKYVKKEIANIRLFI